MLNSMKKFICIALALVLFCTCTGDIFARGPVRGHVEFSAVNPLYAGAASQEKALAVTSEYRTSSVAAEYTTDMDEAASDLRTGMVQRQEAITVYFAADGTVALQDIFDGIFEKALEHTGVANEGDYLRWVWKSCQGSAGYTYSDGVYYYDITYNMTYYTTASQEAVVTERVELLLDELNLDGKRDYEKLCAVYDWMCDNIVYDYDNLNDESYVLKFSAYAALVNKTAVCQGYAVLLYRLMLELGIDCRVIAGTGNGGDHAWNIVELDGLYYNLDSTWDASYAQLDLDYAYFLKCDDLFDDHVRNAEYSTEAFYTAYPMGSADYVPPAVKGDADQNGNVDAKDLTLLARHLTGVETLADEAALAGVDVNLDGKIDAADLTLLARYVAGIITSWENAA